MKETDRAGGRNGGGLVLHSLISLTFSAIRTVVYYSYYFMIISKPLGLVLFGDQKEVNVPQITALRTFIYLVRVCGVIEA